MSFNNKQIGIIIFLILRGKFKEKIIFLLSFIILLNNIKIKNKVFIKVS
jgi:hypothetical protein